MVLVDKSHWPKFLRRLSELLAFIKCTEISSDRSSPVILPGEVLDPCLQNRKLMVHLGQGGVSLTSLNFPHPQMPLGPILIKIYR